MSFHGLPKVWFLILACLQMNSAALEFGHRAPSALKFRQRARPRESPRLCIAGKLYPQLWVLGAQKCSTTLFAKDLDTLGIRSDDRSGRKELHFLDLWRPDDHSNRQVFKALQSAWIEQLPDCPQALELTGGNGGKAQPEIIADFTPSNLRSVPLPLGTRPTGMHWGKWADKRSAEAIQQATGQEMNSPALIKQLYGSEASKPTFVILLREPLARMQSNWYHSAAIQWRSCTDCKARSFQEALLKTLKKAQGSPGSPPSYDDWLWTSMYGRQMKEWMLSFEPRQFYVIPMYAYIKGDRLEICRELSTRLSLEMPCEMLLRPREMILKTEHPDLQGEMIEASTLAGYEEIFREENEVLLKLLARASQAGAGMAGYRGEPGNVEAIRSWLFSNW
eukprot:CAMPEP_0170607336 /NCGR_PEP_ID=MMETSP0224-20130122/20999_1 /TAXON_ID=285029 /ORGANISM="Togula jolla, Strain CCCM 725" /LENGTH=391 /DNA_ID=CAMNT_0010932493 /DNA_START=39 /DNA_END=1214 /DNA_ORIENTATION=+